MALRVILSFTILWATAAWGQALIQQSGGAVRLMPSDAAILESHETRADLGCVVKPMDPEIGFDLALHAGYEVRLPMEQLGGSGNRLTAIFRVTPDGNEDQTFYFSQNWAVPKIAADKKGTAHLEGRFVLGEGRYQVEWLLRDVDERYCSARWSVTTTARGRVRPVELRVPPQTAAAETKELFGSEGPVQRNDDHALHVLVLLHIASEVQGASAMGESEKAAVLSILRSIAREPRIGTYSITAFNLERNEVLYRRRDAPQVDFPALGEAVRGLQLGTIDIRKLSENDAEGEFLSKLVTEELTAGRVDAVIFVGPKASYTAKGKATLKELMEPQCPVFYLSYSGDPALSPWRDLIGSVVKLWKGMEYNISKPRDLLPAWTEVMSRISRAQGGDVPHTSPAIGSFAKK